MRELCMHVIVQDCAEKVRRQLEVVLSGPRVFDAIRYCDGGSEDETCAVIQKYTKQHRDRVRIELHHRRWDDDYSAQDNMLLAQARPGDWVLVQDSDEMPSRPLLEHLWEIVAACEFSSDDMVAVPAITCLDGRMEQNLTEFIAGVRSGLLQPFRKHWLFRFDDRVRTFGTPHRELRRLQPGRDVFGNRVHRFDWKVCQTEYPYVHYKTTWSFILNDVLHAWINPSASEYTMQQITEMRAAVPSTIRTSKELHDWLLAGVSKEHPVWKFAARYQDANKAIRNWWPVLCKGIGQEAEIWV